MVGHRVDPELFNGVGGFGGDSRMVQEIVHKVISHVAKDGSSQNSINHEFRKYDLEQWFESHLEQT